MSCSTHLSVLKKYLDRTLSQQCVGLMASLPNEVPKLKCNPDSQIGDVVLRLPKNNHPIKPFDIKVFEKV